MRCTNGLPDKQTVGYTLLELVAISGELPANQLCRLPGGDSYKLNVVRALKSQKLLRTYYRDGVRGYRLTASAKKALCRDVPERFSFSLSGSAETNLVKSEITRRLHLHRVAEATLTMKNAGVLIFRDEKPDVFSPEYCRLMCGKQKHHISLPVQSEPDEDGLSMEQLSSEDNTLDKLLEEQDICMLLQNCKRQYTGTARLGIEAIEWKVKGLSGAEIAKMYGVKPNLVGAWISRAAGRLKQNRDFMQYFDRPVEMDSS